MAFAPEIVAGDWQSVERALRVICKKLGPLSTPTFGQITIDGGPVTSALVSNWNAAYGWGGHAGLYLPLAGTAADSDKLDGQHGAYYQVAGSYQPLATNLTSLAGLTYVSASFVKMTAAGTFTLDTNIYYKSGDNPTFANITDSALSVAGFVKNSVAGLLSTEAFGTATYIPYSSGTGFSYSANLTFVDPALTCLGTIGVGTSAITMGIISAVKSINDTLVYGITGTITQLKGSNNTGVIGLDFQSLWNPASLLGGPATVTLQLQDGTQLTLGSIMPASAAKNMAITNSYGYRFAGISYDKGSTNAAKTMTVGTMYQFAALNPTLLNGATITTAYAFYDPGITTAGTNWGCAINTQSYFNASVSIGKNTAPTVPLDVVGAIKTTTTVEAGTNFRCGGTAAVADGTYTVGARLTPVTGIDGTITTKGGIITAIQPAT